MSAAAPVAQRSIEATQPSNTQNTPSAPAPGLPTQSTIASAATPAPGLLHRPKKGSFLEKLIWCFSCCGIYAKKKTTTQAPATPAPTAAGQPVKWSLTKSLKWFLCCCGLYIKKAPPAPAPVPAATSAQVITAAPAAVAPPTPEPSDHYASWMQQELPNIEAEVTQLRDANPESRERAREIRRTMRAFVFASATPSPERGPLRDRAQRLIDVLTNFIGDRNFQHDLDVLAILQDLPNIEREVAAFRPENPANRERARELRWVFRILATALNRQNPQHGQLREKLQRLERQLTELIGDIDWQNTLDTIGVQQILTQVEQDIQIVPAESTSRRQELAATLRLIERALNSENPRHNTLRLTSQRLSARLAPPPVVAAT